MPHRFLPILALLIFATSLRAVPPTKQPANPFIVVMIDKPALAHLGPFPFDRGVFASAVNRAAGQHARAVVLKFFFDAPRGDGVGDRALADSMTHIKVLLESTINNAEPNPAELPPRFTLPIQSPDASLHAITGNNAWLPLPVLSERAAGIGFVDSPSGAVRVPAVEHYRGHYVKSLWTSCLELATSDHATIVPGQSMKLAGKTLPLDTDSMLPVRYPTKDNLSYLSLSNFLRNDHPEVADKIVIFAWDADDTGAVQTPLGNLTPHRAFCYTLFSLWDQLQQQ